MAQGYKAGIATGLALGLCAGLLSPLWRPSVARWGRPAAKNAVKGGLAAYEVARRRFAELSENASDLVAEAQVERAAEMAHKAPIDDEPGRAAHAAD